MPFFFDSWTSIGRIALAAVLGFLCIVFFIRLFGNRSTAKMTNFDWLVTVAMGSLLASMILIKDVALFDGLTAILCLLAMQFLFSKMSQKSERIRQLLINPPCLLYFDGQFVQAALRDERIARKDVLQGMREAGYADLDEIYAVILESNAELSVIGQREAQQADLLQPVRGFPEAIEEAPEAA